MQKLKPGVYWCARDMGYMMPVGNHHFILVVLNQSGELFGQPTLSEKFGEGVIFFATVSTTKMYGEIGVVINGDSDVEAVREYVDPKEHTSLLESDFDMRAHFVPAPDEDIEKLVADIERLTKNFAGHSPGIPYSLLDENCACWVNTLFKVAGLPKELRVELGEFSGVDWGEEDLMNEKFFDPPLSG